MLLRSSDWQIDLGYQDSSDFCLAATLSVRLFWRTKNQQNRGPRDAEVEAFLTHLAVDRKSASSTQNQAMNVLVFLYREMIKKGLGQVSAIRAKRPVRLPTVLSREEVHRSMEAMPANSMRRLVVRSPTQSPM